MLRIGHTSHVPKSLLKQTNKNQNPASSGRPILERTNQLHMLNYAWVDDHLQLHLGSVCLKHSLTACTFGRTTRDNGLEYK